jgi:hypothetical protein
MLELWLVVVGSLVHGVYGLSGSNVVLGLLVPVNESVWEHFKLGYAAMLLWHVVPDRWRTPTASRHWLPTIMGVLVINMCVIVTFHVVRPLFTDHVAVLSVDIGSYLVGSIIAGQMIRRWPTSWRLHQRLGILLWIAVGVIFVYATVWPPHYPLFIHGGMGN